jgi:CRP/FNR family transcriptional regulator
VYDPQLTLPVAPHRLEAYDRVFGRGGVSDRRMAAPGRELVRAGENFGSLGAVFTGWAYRYKLLADGRRQILTFLLPGDGFGLDTLFYARPQHAVQAATPVTYGVIENEALTALIAGSPDFTLALLRRAAAERRALDRQALLLGRCTAEERMATLLIGLHARLRRRRLGGSHSFNLPLTQQQIGDHIGLTVVHVNRVLRRFREQGIATVRQHAVVFHNLPRLRALAHLDDELEVPSPMR